MNGGRRILVALAGAEQPTLFGILAPLLGLSDGAGAEVLLLHVIDAGPRVLLEHDRGSHRAPWPAPRPGQLERRMEAADEEGAAGLLALWSERCTAAIPGVEVATHVRRGRPEQEIVQAARELGANVVVVQVRTRPGPVEPGPRSVGHVARFVLDHAPVPVLLVRGRP